MTTTYLTHEICANNIKSVRRILPYLLSFDPTLSEKEDYEVTLEDAEDMGYSSNIEFLQDKLMYLYCKRDRELEAGDTKIYKPGDFESTPTDSDECLMYAIDSLLDYIKAHTEDRIFSSIKIGYNYVSVALSVEVYD